jgi:hypothetical protein
MMYEIWIRDSQLDRIAPVLNFTKLTLNMNFNDVGKWILELPPEETESINKLLEVRREGNGLGGIIVTRDGNIIFSGPIRNIEMNEDWSSDEDNGSFIVYGIDDTGLLATRMAVPPVPEDGQYRFHRGTGIGYDVVTGSSETCMLHLVENNIGYLAVDGRAIPLLATTTDGLKGTTITVRSRYDYLIDKLKEAALSGGLGFRVIQSYDDFFEIPVLLFEVFEPEDVTGTVVFSKERRNLSGYKYHVEAPEGNYILCGGGGENTARYFVGTGDEPSRLLYGTIEYFLDQRQTTVEAELLQALYNELEERTEKTRLEIYPIDVEGTRFMEDYDLGYKATVEVQGETIHDVIRSVQITLDKDGEIITPFVGTPGTYIGTAFRLFDDYRRLQGRVGKIERR